MTDKEQIMIDGVDVSKCYRYQKKTGYCEGAFKPEELPFCENFDCEFKQLARSTQRIKDLEERIINHSDEIEEYCRRLADKDKECEELKKELRELKLKHTTLQNRYQQLDGATRYRKALEDIEEYCENQISITGDLPFRTTASDILDIISRAKGEK